MLCLLLSKFGNFSVAYGSLYYAYFMLWLFGYCCCAAC